MKYKEGKSSPTYVLNIWRRLRADPKTRAKNENNEKAVRWAAGTFKANTGLGVERVRTRHLKLISTYAARAYGKFMVRCWREGE